MTIGRPGRPVENHVMPRLGDQNLSDTLPWIMTLARDALLEDLPVSTHEVEADPSLWEMPSMKKGIETLQQTIINTNSVLQSHKHLANVGKRHADLLFYNVDDSGVFTKLQESFNELPGDHIHYRNMSTGFDKTNRSWGKVTFPTAEELIELIISLRIKSLFTVNMFLLEFNLLRKGIYLPALFRFLGVELVIVDIDHYDMALLGYMGKAIFHDGLSRRYSIFPHMQAFWDDELKLKNVLYMPTFRNIKKDVPPPVLDEDYSPIIISNSRYETIGQNLNQTLFVLDNLDEGQIFDVYQKWYHAMRCLIRGAPNFSLISRLAMNMRVYETYLSLMTFLKFEVIHSIKTDRQVLLFGDKGWEGFFPQYYRGYLNEADAARLFSKKKYLNILVNQNYFYLEANPVLQLALDRNIPFISQPAIHVKDGLEGLRGAEYGNATRLNELIGDANLHLNNPAVVASVTELRRQIVECETAFVQSVLGETAFDYAFKKISDDYGSHIQKTLQAFIAEHFEFMGQCFQMCLNGNPPASHRPELSSYYGRPYLKNFLSKEG